MLSTTHTKKKQFTAQRSPGGHAYKSGKNGTGAARMGGITGRLVLESLLQERRHRDARTSA